MDTPWPRAHSVCYERCQKALEVSSAHPLNLKACHPVFGQPAPSLAAQLIMQMENVSILFPDWPKNVRACTHPAPPPPWSLSWDPTRRKKKYSSLLWKKKYILHINNKSTAVPLDVKTWWSVWMSLLLQQGLPSTFQDQLKSNYIFVAEVRVSQRGWALDLCPC